MPIYEYECPSCGQFEVTQRITDEALKRCPSCKKRKVRKLMSSTSFQLKGSGWYVTDYARKGASGPGGDAKNSSESSSETKSEKSEKSETKSESKGKDGKTSKKESSKAA